MENKYVELIQNLKKYDKVVIGYSGGVDSNFLLYSAKEALGVENVIAITVSTMMYPKREKELAIKNCKEMGINHKILNLDESSIYNLEENNKDRCYHCKKAIFNLIIKETSKMDNFIYLDGSNLDDLGDYRPGLKAIDELEIISPMKDVGLTKMEIRNLSKKYGLNTWDYPSMACLASRIPYGSKIKKEILKRIEVCEDFLWDKGFRGFRVRHHGNIARIELSKKDMIYIFDEEEKLEELVEFFKKEGYIYVTLDLSGYSIGSMNKELDI